jgi:thioredoxin-like negative regulator of GroEL
MDTQPIDNLVAEKLEMIPEVIKVTLHRHDEQFTEAKEAFETGYIYEALDALSEAAKAFADLAAYISYVESRYDLLQEAADPSPAKERNY